MGERTAMEIFLANVSKLCRVCFLLGLVLSSSSAISNEPKRGSQTNLNWTSVVQEVNEIMPDKRWCKRDHFCEYSIGNTPICPCYDQCMTYGGCCLDQAARNAEQGIKAEPEKYMCWHLEVPDPYDVDRYKKVVMVRNCLEMFAGSNVEHLCFKQPSDVLSDPLLEHPVISFKTNITYLNYYCAQCNNDAMNLVPMVYKVECVTRSPPGIPHKYLYSLKFPSANDFAMTETSAPQHYLLSETQDQYFAFAGFKDNRGVLERLPRIRKRQILRNPADFSAGCSIKKRKYKNVGEFRNKYETSPCRHASKLDQVQKCNAKWDNKEDFEKCRSYSLTASVNQTEYKNPHCARCNFEDMTLLYVACASSGIHPVKVVFSTPQCEIDWEYDWDMKDCVPKRW